MENVMARRTRGSFRTDREGDLGWVAVAAVSGESILLVQDARASHPHLWQLPRKRTYPMESEMEAGRRILGLIMRRTIYARAFDYLDTVRFGRQRAEVFLINVSLEDATAFESREKNPEMQGKFFAFQDVLAMSDLNNEDRPFLKAIATSEEDEAAKMPQTP